MEIRKNINFEQMIYILVFIIGIIFRLYHLGEVNLSDNEAALALQAMNLPDGTNASMLPYPVYILWTGLLFFLFPDNTFLARLIPALAGSLIVLIPFYLRYQMGRRAAIILAIALAIDPAFVAVSRIAGGHMLGITFLLFSLVMFLNKRPVAAGIFFGLTLLSAPSIWLGILPLLFMILWVKFSGRRRDSFRNGNFISIEGLDSTFWKKGIISLGATLFFAGTLFFTVPYGISNVVDGMLAFFSNWLTFEEPYITRTLAALLIYEILPFALALWALLSRISHGDDIDTIFCGWFLLSLVFIFLYPAGQVQNIIWVVFPAWALAGRKLAGFMDMEQEDRTTIYGQSLAVFILCVFCFINMLGIVNGNGSDTDNQLRMIGLIGGLVIMVLVTFFVGWGWSIHTAVKGFSVGIFLSLSVLMLAQNARYVGNFTYHETQELWDHSADVPQADLLLQTIGDYSEWNTGIRTETDMILLEETAGPAMKWALRDYDKMQVLEYVPISMEPSMVITAQNQELGLAKDYSGQDFVIDEKPVWDDFNIEEWFLWATVRKAETEKQYAVLWIQSDLFPAAGILETGKIEE